jgi:hypothetical protein
MGSEVTKREGPVAQSAGGEGAHERGRQMGLRPYGLSEAQEWRKGITFEYSRYPRIFTTRATILKPIYQIYPSVHRIRH